MKEVLEINNKVVVYGSKKDVEETVNTLNIFCDFLKNNPEEIRARKRI